jgi:hypothetical protein
MLTSSPSWQQSSWRGTATSKMSWKVTTNIESTNYLLRGSLLRSSSLLRRRSGDWCCGRSRGLRLCFWCCNLLGRSGLLRGSLFGRRRFLGSGLLGRCLLGRCRLLCYNLLNWGGFSHRHLQQQVGTRHFFNAAMRSSSEKSTKNLNAGGKNTRSMSASGSLGQHNARAAHRSEIISGR